MPCLLLLSLCSVQPGEILLAQSSTLPTAISIGTAVQQSGVKRLGMNLGYESYYDSSQIMNNLVYRNPGFEGEMWQSIVHCQTVTATTCTDDKNSVWAANFFQGATVEFLDGSNVGTTGVVVSNTYGELSTGVQLTFSSALNPSVGDYLAVRMLVPGNGIASWAPSTSGSGTITTETTDISPNSAGKQALSLSAPGTSTADLATYFDTTGGTSFVQLNGTYTLSFRTKLVSGTPALRLGVGRLGVANYLDVTPTLSNSWQDMSFTFTANEVQAIGSVKVSFGVTGGTALLDDVSLTRVPAANNPTVFRDAVVNTLRTLNPGVLRYMDGGTDWGSSIDNMLQPPSARLRAGYSNWNSESDDIPIGLHEFMVLCQAVGTEPWFTMSSAMSVADMQNLMDYLGGSTSTVYGARRAALGQSAPWTSVFPQIHLEFGNEVWNTANPGQTYSDVTAYAKRASLIFAVAKASPSYSSSAIDLIIDGWEFSPGWTTAVLAAATGYDTVSQAAYFFGPFTDASSKEAIFGSMFSIPEQTNSNAGGLMVTRVNDANTAAVPAKTAIYEANIGTINGTVNQAALDETVPSLGAGLTTALNLLTLMRDQGVVNMSMFTLAQYAFGFQNTNTGATEAVKLYGTLVDMGGLTNLRRPSFLANQLANQAILPVMLTASQTGNNPTWNQAYDNGANAIPTAHYLQSFAFTNGTTNSLILFNLSRSTALPVTFTGSNAPNGSVAVSTLTSPNITDNNETTDTVDIVNSSLSSFDPSVGITLPPYSMTVLTSGAPTIAAIAISCSPTTLQTSATSQCSTTITGNGTFSSAVTWSATAGSITPSGLYTSPSSITAAQQITITATSVQDTTKTAIETITVAPTITGVSVTCPSSTMQLSATQTCTANVSGTQTYSSAVTWAATGGTVDQNGVVTSPATASTIVVRATSVQDPTQAASFTISAAATPVLSGVVFSALTPTSVTVTWTSNILIQGGAGYGPNYGTISFNSAAPYTRTPSVTLNGLTPGTTYNLLVYGYSTTGLLSALYTNGFTTPAATITSVTASCSPTTILAGATVSCSSAVTGTGAFTNTVNWSASSGTISAAGVYTAPASVTASQSVTITAAATQDSTKTATQIITVNPIPSAISGVAVTCAASTVQPSATDVCTVSVTGTGPYASTVVWSATGGSVSQAGLVTAPPSNASIVVTATSTQDSTKSGTFTVSAVAPTITSVALSCSPTTLIVGSSASCTPTVAGTGAYSSTVTLSASSGTISASGVYATPATVTSPQSVTVTATSTQDPTKTGTLILTVNPIPVTITGVGVTCASSAVQLSTTDACKVSVAGTGAFPSTVVWSATGGTVDQTGLVTAPAIAGPVVVTATSTLDSTKSGTFLVTALAPTITSVALACSPTILPQGTTSACTSSVAGTGAFSPAVTWSASAGSISAAGLYTAPALVAASQSVSIIATSTQDPTKSAAQIITITPPVYVSGVSVTCPLAQVSAKAIETCQATVLGTGITNSAVVWSVSPNSLISQAGVVNTTATPGTVTVTATSAQDPTKSGSFNITAFASATLSGLVTTSTATSVTVSWTSNIPIQAGLDYGPTYGLTVFNSAAPYTTTPSITVTGLTPGTKYNLLVFGYSTNRVFSSINSSFTTLSGASTVTSVAMACSPTTLIAGTTSSCTPTVLGTGPYSPTVTWTASAGTISAAGIYTAPPSVSASQNVTVTATSTQDSTKAATQILTVTPVPSTITGVGVTCAASTVQLSMTDVCKATVVGTGPFVSTVVWSASGGTVSQTGLVTAPASAATIVVTATSSQDSTKSGTFTITALAATITSVALSCPTTVVSGASSTCTSSVAGTGAYSSAVTWSASAGTISVAGLYTAPTPVTASQSVSITATSTQDPTKTAAQTITVTPVSSAITGVVVTCAASSVQTSATDACKAAVTGTGPFVSTVTWLATAGSVSSAGLVTAPASAATIVVTATSTQDSTKVGTYTLSAIAPTITSVAISCSPTTLAAGTTSSCTPTVAGTGSFSSAVTWTASSGAISATGMYSAPASVSAAQSVTVTATSTQDPTKTATQILTVNPAGASTISGVNVTCALAVASIKSTNACTASVTGTGAFASTVVWSATGATISQAGVVTTPASNATIVVTATSTQDSTRMGSFTMIAAAPVMDLLVITPITATTATLSWRSNVPVQGGVSYGTTGLSSSQYNPSGPYTTNPTVTLTGLTPGTYYKVEPFGFTNSRVFGYMQYYFTTATK